MSEDEQIADYQPGDFVPDHAAESRPLKIGYDFRGLSIFSFPDCDADEIAGRARKRLPHDQIRESTAGEIRAAGFELRRTTDTPGHFSLVFDGRPSDDDLRMVLRLFERCKENEYRRSK